MNTSVSSGLTKSATNEMPALVLSDQDFQRVVDRVFATSGIVLQAHKRQMVISRLSRRLHARGFSSFSDYLDHLDAGTDSAELEAFSNALTTNLTSFFREAHHFEHFTEHVVVPVLAAGESRLRVWSAGCSTGEEPYSIALALFRLGKRLPGDFRILATDIDTNVLARGKAGLYESSRTTTVPADAKRWLRPAQAGMVEVAADVRRMISFLPLNLLHDWPVKGPFNAIFCRNVLIYFDAQTKARIIDRFAELLPSGGFLYLGHSESILGEHKKLAGLGRTIYRRK